MADTHFQADASAGSAQDDEAQRVIVALYSCLLHRMPGPDELLSWKQTLLKGMAVSKLIDSFLTSEEYTKRSRVVPFFVPGHYYSPIVSPDESVRKYMMAQAGRVGHNPRGIDLRLGEMKEFLASNSQFMSSHKFPEHQCTDHRFYWDNGTFPLMDAMVLRAVINSARPRRIIEIGSGFSTASMLDTADEISLALKITCIEPYPDRLRNLLRPSDNVELLECPVQDVPVSRFSELQEGDILFIDSTHVLKSGSDVHYELFEILPSLNHGVLIHFHDCHYPFEYPLEWIFDRNFSWNEIYALRAFLMYNSKFLSFYSQSTLSHLEPDFVRMHLPECPNNRGGSFWLRKE